MTEAEQLIADCEKAAKFYERSPGLVTHMAIIDLYRTMARLASLLPRRQGIARERPDGTVYIELPTSTSE